MSGIFRDVYILTRSKSRINDFKLTTSVNVLSNEGVINLEILATVGNPNISYTLLEPNNTVISSGNIIENNLQINISNAQLWDAENPNLYTLLLQTETEVIKEKVGLREIKIENSILKINDVPVKIKGVNHHDSDPFKGYAITYDDLIVDLKLMKENNIFFLIDYHCFSNE